MENVKSLLVFDFKIDFISYVIYILHIDRDVRDIDML